MTLRLDRAVGAPTRRLHDLPGDTLELLRVTAVLGDAVSLRDVAAVTRRPPAEVVAQLGHAFDARLLAEVDERVVFRHQLVHDAIYQQVPPSARRVLHREAAVVLMAVGADRLDVADHLILGAERGDEQAIAGCGTPPARLRLRRHWSPSSSCAEPTRCCQGVIARRIWCRRNWSRRCCAPESLPRRQIVHKRC